MNQQEIIEAIQDIPIGSLVQLIRKNGSIIEVKLASHEVSATEAKDYGEIEIPALPPALIVTGRSRFGKYRIDIDEIVKIARIG